MNKTVLLLSGISEGPSLAQALLAAGFNVIATVTREDARHNLFGSLHAQPPPGLTIEVCGFTEDRLSHFLGNNGADLVLDATHPFAVRITRIASTVCQRLGRPYVRYERPDWAPPEDTIYASSYVEAAEMLPTLGARVMLTIGAKQLKHFTTLHERLTLFARILPSPTSVQQALDAGFTQHRILAIRPPFSQAFNRSLLEEYRADVLVSKASGAAGGVIEKVMAAHELGLTTLMIQRPDESGGSAAATVAEAVQACRAIFLPPLPGLGEG